MKLRLALRRTVLVAAIVAAAITAPFAVDAQPTPVEVTLEPREATIGDRISVELMLIWNGSEPTDLPRFPNWDEGWGDAEVLSVGPIEAVSGPRRIYVQELEIAAFRTGDILLPELSVEVPVSGERTVRVPVPRTLFTVRPLLPEGLEVDPRPPAGPKELPGGLDAPDQRAFAAVTAVQAALCALALVWHRRRKVVAAPAAPEEPPLAPIDAFENRLTTLDPDACEEAHFGLSLALRAFLGERLGFPALESTTREMPARLRRADVPKSAAEKIDQLLRACDEVKFAKRLVDGEVVRDRLVDARKAARDVERHVRRLEIEAEAASTQSSMDRSKSSR